MKLCMHIPSIPQNINYKAFQFFVGKKWCSSCTSLSIRKYEQQQQEDVILLSGPRERGHHDNVQEHNYDENDNERKRRGENVKIIFLEINILNNFLSEQFWTDCTHTYIHIKQSLLYRVKTLKLVEKWIAKRGKILI